MLSDEQIDELWRSHEKQWPELGKRLINLNVFARAIEAAVLAELAKQEPVAHVVDRENCRVWWNDSYTHISQAPKNGTPLYAALVAAHEREECAKVCDERAMKNESAAQDGIANGEHDEVSSIRSAAWQISCIAAAIRGRG